MCIQNEFGFWTTTWAWKVGSDGLLHTTANAHETQWQVTDPVTDILAMQALFPVVVSAAQTLNTDQAFVSQLQAAEQKIPPLPRTTVRLDAYAAGERILISVSDRCGGIPSAALETMFLPFAQGGTDRTGLGLGLSISRKYVEACHGTLTCRNMPGEGCVFTIDLPRRLLKPVSAPALV